jgi:hypothetical protein
MGLGDKEMIKDTNFKKWLEAQIALQQEVLDGLKESEERSTKEGQIALKVLELKKKE